MLGLLAATVRRLRLRGTTYHRTRHHHVHGSTMFMAPPTTYRHFSKKVDPKEIQQIQQELRRAQEKKRLEDNAIDRERRNQVFENVLKLDPNAEDKPNFSEMVDVEVASLKKADEEKKKQEQEVEKKKSEKRNHILQKVYLWANPKTPEEKKSRTPWNDANMRKNMERRKEKKSTEVPPGNSSKKRLLCFSRTLDTI